MKIHARAALCRGLTGPADVVVTDIDIAAPAADELLIRVHSAALNFPDLLMTTGSYQFRPELPFILGMEAAGEVVRTGRDVTDFQPGDHVTFHGKTGAVSEYATVSSQAAAHMPPSLSFDEAAAFAVTFSTAYVTLASKGRLAAGESLLVHGAGGGVGQACVSVGKALGAHVIAVASTEQKLHVARQSGADHLVCSGREDFVARVLDLTGGSGADVIVDPVGGSVLERSVGCLGWQGRLLVVGFASGEFGRPSLQQLQDCGGSLTGVRAGEYGRRNPALGKQARDALAILTREKGLKPCIGAIWPLARIQDALQHMAARQAVGKQIIRLSNVP